MPKWKHLIETISKTFSMMAAEEKMMFNIIFVVAGILIVICFISWLVLKNKDPEMARKGLIFSIIGSASVILIAVLLILPEYLTTEQRNAVITSISKLKKFIIPAIVVAIIIKIILSTISKCPNCGKRGGLKKIKTISLGEANSGYKTKTLRTNYYDKNNRRTRYSTRQVRVQVTKEPMLTTYICKYCGEECQKKWTDEQEV